MTSLYNNKGGKAFAKASVDKIIFSGRQATGVTVRDRSGRQYNIHAPNIVSSVGLLETRAMLPSHIDKMSKMSQVVNSLNSGISSIIAMLILNGTKEEVGIGSASGWYFEQSDLGRYFSRWYNHDLHQAMKEPFPILVFSSNSAKDPTWTQHPKQRGKSTMHIITPANWKWFEKLNITGPEYKVVKDAFGRKIVDKMQQLCPSSKSRIEYMEVWTPFNMKEYLGKHKGAIYGLQNDMAKLDDPSLVARMRAGTDIPGLYLSGKDYVCQVV